MMFNEAGDFVAVAENGTVIRDTGVGHVGASCPTVTKSGNTFSISANGNVSSLNRTIQGVLASAGGKFLVYGSDNRLYLRDDPCLPDGLSVSPTTISGVVDAQMVKAGNHFYIAVRVGGDVNYYRVSGNSSTLLTTVSGVVAGKFDYALDGAGRLYTKQGTNQVRVYSNTNGSTIGTSAALPNPFVAMLGLADRVLVRDNGGNLYEIIPTPSVPRTDVTEAILRDHFNNCTDATHTKAVDGIGTNFIRCLYDQGSSSGNGQRLSSIAFVDGQYRRPNALAIIAPAPTSSSRPEVDANDILFGANALIVRRATDSRIILCTTTSTTISCSNTGVLNASGKHLGFADFSTLSSFYLKSNGSDVFYRSGTTLFVGNVFNPTPILSITVSSATGGNASFDLRRFAFSFRPPTAPFECNTQIVYLPSANGPVKFYTLDRANTCVARILKVY